MGIGRVGDGTSSVEASSADLSRRFFSMNMNGKEGARERTSRGEKHGMLQRTADFTRPCWREGAARPSKAVPRKEVKLVLAPPLMNGFCLEINAV